MPPSANAAILFLICSFLFISVLAGSGHGKECSDDSEENFCETKEMPMCCAYKFTSTFHCVSVEADCPYINYQASPLLDSVLGTSYPRSFVPSDVLHPSHSKKDKIPFYGYTQESAYYSMNTQPDKDLGASDLKSGKYSHGNFEHHSGFIPVFGGQVFSAPDDRGVELGDFDQGNVGVVCLIRQGGDLLKYAGVQTTVRNPWRLNFHQVVPLLKAKVGEKKCCAVLLFGSNSEFLPVLTHSTLNKGPLPEASWAPHTIQHLARRFGVEAGDVHHFPEARMGVRVDYKGEVSYEAYKNGKTVRESLGKIKACKE